MAKQGKKISARQKSAIKVKYEAGIMSITEIAKQHQLTRETVSRLAKREGWKRGKSHEKVTKKITKRAVDKLVEKEGDKLFDYVSTYVANIKNLDKAHIANLNSYVLILEAGGGNISKAEADKFKSVQQFLKLSAETFKINFEGIRLAMGLDKKQNENKPLQINIVNYKDADDSF